MSGMFPHRVIDQTEGFLFVVSPSDPEDQASVDEAQEVEDYLNENWHAAPSELSVDEARDPEEAELILVDAREMLADGEFDVAESLIITSVAIIGQLAVVWCSVGEEADEDEADEVDESSFD